jgi:enediyne biosynthesis protein E4
MNSRTICLALSIVPAGLIVLSTATPLFHEIASDVGLDFHHFTGATGEYYMPEIMGSGVALLDYDNDGDLDVYVIQGTVPEHGEKPLLPPLSGSKPGNRLFANMLSQTGHLRFVDVTDRAGVGHDGYGMGAATGDYDNDGFLDLYVTNFGHNVLYRNNGNGTFADVTRQAGVDDARWSTSSAFLDYDGDGYLDLFVGNYVDFTVKGNKRCYAPTGEPDYCTPKAYKAVPSRLFHNQGNGQFVDATDLSGIGSSYGPALGVVCADFNGDGRTDIYVANDTAANRLWVNQGDGTFRERALEAGVAYNAEGLTKAGMGVAAEDVDNQDTLAILVTNLAREGATLFRGDGKGLFEDVTLQSGLAAPTFAFTGFGTRWLDYDNDGRLDLFIANGAVSIVESLRGERYPYGQRNLLFHNEGKTFHVTSDVAGPAFQRIDVGRGAAIGDLDNDGAVDILVTNNNGAVRLLRNEIGSRQHWLQVRLEGVRSNRFGIGARVAVVREGEAPLWRRVHTDSSYLSASDVRVHFGLGRNPDVQSVIVHWPDGSKESWDNVQPDAVVVLRQGSGKSR